MQVVNERRSSQKSSTRRPAKQDGSWVAGSVSSEPKAADNRKDPKEKSEESGQVEVPVKAATAVGDRAEHLCEQGR